jgi:hypothetical protein
MEATRELAVRSLSAARHIGPHPVRLGAAVGEKMIRRRRQQRLRRTYADRIARPAGSAVLRAPAPPLPAVDELPPELRRAAAGVRADAEAILGHRVDYLGSGLVALGPEFDWHRDFKSGYRWPAVFYQDLEVTRLGDDSDAKVPWELSRGHQLLTLARAARLYEDERYTAELEHQLTSWLDANPTGLGINWVNAMEVAIRALNWAWAIGTMEQWRPLDPGLRRRVTHSLQAHGRHIAANLEGSRLLRGNHYLADVLGLFALGAFLEGDPMADRWLRFGLRELEREISDQVLVDGVGFEASLPYHGLALELFLLGWLVAGRHGRTLSRPYRERLERMLEVSRAVRHPDGRIPIFGDQDSGRVLPGGFGRPATHDNLLDIGAALLDLPRLVPGPAPDEEVAWTLGLDAWRRLAGRESAPVRPATAFPHGGLYVLRGAEAHLVARWGGVGQNGNGGHGHNDLSSYELSYGAPLVVDSGTYAYTSDPVARDAFRSARAHNVLVVDGLDMHPLPPASPFQMPAHARFGVECWEEARDFVVLAGWHDGYRRDGAALTCRRTITLDRGIGRVDVLDEVEGASMRTLESFMHLAAGADVTPLDERTVRVTAGGCTVTVAFEGADAVHVETGWVSEQFGVRVAAPVLRAVAARVPPARLSYRVEPT